MDEEKKRSGVKAQRRSEGTGGAGDAGAEEGGAEGCTWKRRTLRLSMRKRRRAEIHFWGGKEVGGAVGERG